MEAAARVERERCAEKFFFLFFFFPPRRLSSLHCCKRECNSRTCSNGILQLPYWKANLFTQSFILRRQTDSLRGSQLFDRAPHRQDARATFLHTESRFFFILLPLSLSLSLPLSIFFFLVSVWMQHRAGCSLKRAFFPSQQLIRNFHRALYIPPPLLLCSTHLSLCASLHQTNI